jgi:hypothetical protein
MSVVDAASAQRAASVYVGALMAEPAEHAVATLATLGGQQSSRAAQELRLLRRALGLLIAGRDALDDRTASLVGRALSEKIATDESVAASERQALVTQFNARLRLYRDLMGTRGAARTPIAQLADALIGCAGGRPGHPEAAWASTWIAQELDRCNDALRDAFGAADLPSDVAPSEIGAPLKR